MKEKISSALLGAISAIAVAVPMGAYATNSATTTGVQQFRRLIEYGPNQRQWMTSDQIRAIGARTHAAGHCGGFMDVTDNPEVRRMFLRSPIIFDNRPLSQGSAVSKVLPELQAKNLYQVVESLSKFPNRFCGSENGRRSAQWIKDVFTQLAGNRTDIKVQFIEHPKLGHPSVLAQIQGSGAHKAEHLVLGAHEDSINWSGGFPSEKKIAPGADDDASGVATLLETFRVLAQSGFRPDRTVDFITYSCEETGLRGSQEVAKLYQQNNIVVAGVFQMDMTFYPGTAQQLTFISDYTDPSLTRFTGRLVDTYVKVRWGSNPCGYACSDHASWSKLGYPATFPFESPMESYNPKIHTVDDTLANHLDAAFGLHFAQLAAAWTIELSLEPNTWY